MGNEDKVLKAFGAVMDVIEGRKLMEVGYDGDFWATTRREVYKRAREGRLKECDVAMVAAKVAPGLVDKRRFRRFKPSVKRALRKAGATRLVWERDNWGPHETTVYGRPSRVEPHEVRGGARFLLRGIYHRVVKRVRRAADGTMYGLCTWDPEQKEWREVSSWGSTEALARHLTEHNAEPVEGFERACPGL